MTLSRRSFMRLSAAAAMGAAAGSATSITRKVQSKTSNNAAPAIKTAGIRLIPIDGGKYKVWTKKIGKGKVKVLTLHGGPGFTHEYLESFEDFLPQRGI